MCLVYCLNFFWCEPLVVLFSVFICVCVGCVRVCVHFFVYDFVCVSVR